VPARLNRPITRGIVRCCSSARRSGARRRRRCGSRRSRTQTALGTALPQRRKDRPSAHSLTSIELIDTAENAAATPMSLRGSITSNATVLSAYALDVSSAPPCSCASAVGAWLETVVITYAPSGEPSKAAGRLSAGREPRRRMSNSPHTRTPMRGYGATTICQL
jgi:hypothetical protein